MKPVQDRPDHHQLVGRSRTGHLQQVGERIVTLGKTYNETVDLEPNAIYLILREPIEEP